MKQIATFVVYLIAVVYAVKWTMISLGRPITIPVLDPLFAGIVQQLGAIIHAISDLIGRKIARFT